MCFIFLFLNLADVAITMSILPRALSKVSYSLLCLMISLAPTDVAKILSFGKIGLGSIKINFLKLKFLIALAHAPIFSDNWGLCKIKEILFLLSYLLAGALSLNSL